nr:MAG TPA: hypothetical protein [Caudoviricetes sp.]
MPAAGSRHKKNKIEKSPAPGLPPFYGTELMFDYIFSLPPYARRVKSNFQKMEKNLTMK